MAYYGYKQLFACTEPFLTCTKTSSKTAHLSLSDGLLDIIVSELISNGVPNTNTVPLKEEVVVDNCLDVAVEIPGHLMVKLHGNDVHEGASLVTKCVLGEDATHQNTMLNKHL